MLRNVKAHAFIALTAIGGLILADQALGGCSLALALVFGMITALIVTS